MRVYIWSCEPHRNNEFTSVLLCVAARCERSRSASFFFSLHVAKAALISPNDLWIQTTCLNLSHSFCSGNKLNSATSFCNAPSKGARHDRSLLLFSLPFGTVETHWLNSLACWLRICSCAMTIWIPCVVNCEVTSVNSGVAARLWSP